MDIAGNEITNMELLRYLWTEKLDPLFWRGVLSGVISAWYGHVPFAHWIIGAAKPRLLVELAPTMGSPIPPFARRSSAAD